MTFTAVTPVNTLLQYDTATNDRVSWLLLLGLGLRVELFVLFGS